MIMTTKIQNKYKLLSGLFSSRLQVPTANTRTYGKLKSWYAGLVQKPPPDPPYSHVIQIGDPILRSPCEKVPPELIKTPEFQFLLQQLKRVAKQYNCVGISAPQIGISLRVFITEFNSKHASAYDKNEFNNKEMSIIPQTVVINPQIKVNDYKKITFTEACESIKGFYADVPRYYAIEVQGLNENSEKVSIKAKGWLARILQHEIDHLHGKLYTDIMDRKTLTCSCWQAVNDAGGKIELPFSY